MITRAVNLILASGIALLTFPASLEDFKHFDWTTVVFRTVIPNAKIPD